MEGVWRVWRVLEDVWRVLKGVGGFEGFGEFWRVFGGFGGCLEGLEGFGGFGVFAGWQTVPLKAHRKPLLWPWPWGACWGSGLGRGVPVGEGVWRVWRVLEGVWRVWRVLEGLPKWRSRLISLGTVALPGILMVSNTVSRVWRAFSPLAVARVLSHNLLGCFLITSKASLV